MSEPGANARHRQGKRAARPKPEADLPKAETERTWPTYRPLESDDAGLTPAPRSTPPASRPSQTEQTPWFSEAPAFKQEKAAGSTRPSQPPASQSAGSEPIQYEAGARYEQQSATRLSQTPLRSEPSRPIPTPLDAQPRRIGIPPELAHPEARSVEPGGTSGSDSRRASSSADSRGAAGTSGLPDGRAAGTSALGADPRTAGTSGLGADPRTAGPSGLDADSRVAGGSGGLDPALRQSAMLSRSAGQTDREIENSFFSPPQPSFRQEPHAQQAGAPTGDRRGRKNNRTDEQPRAGRAGAVASAGAAGAAGAGRSTAAEAQTGVEARAEAGQRVGSDARVSGAPVRMSDPGARARRGGGGGEPPAHEDGRPRSRARRPVIAVLALLLVGGPITWLLMHQPNNNIADGSIPFMDREDDTYVTPSAKPIGASTKPTAKASTPPASVPTTTPSTSPTETPSTSESSTPTPTQKGTATTFPTQGPTQPTATNQPTVPEETPTDGPTTRPTQKPTDDPTQPPPPPKPPARDGQMTGQELELFDLIDNARQDKGCKPLEQDPSVTSGARSDAEDRSEEGNVNGGSGSMAAAGGDDWSAREAFNRMMDKNRSAVLNCSHTTLGVGADGYKYCASGVDPLGLCLGSRNNRVAWVADFT